MRRSSAKYLVSAFVGLAEAGAPGGGGYRPFRRGASGASGDARVGGACRPRAPPADGGWGHPHRAEVAVFSFSGRSSVVDPA